MKTLAINGGPQAAPGLPARFHFGAEEKAAADALFDQCIKSGNPIVYGGPEEGAFCQEFAESMGGGYADGINSGTNSVFAALKSLDLPPFSEVVVGCVTDPGGMMPIAQLCCIPVPADTAPGSFNSGPAEIEARITERTSAIVIAHIGGEPADMPGIMAVAQKYGLPVVEDCAQAHSAFVNGQRCGTFGTLSAFSLMFGKHICAGGQGGVVFTKSEDQYWRLRSASDRGKPFNRPAGSTNGIYSINCNMDDLHAAIARVQLKKLPDIIKRRQAFVRMMLERGFGELPGIYIPQKDLKPGFESCYWWWRLRFDAAKLKCGRAEFCKALAAEGLQISENYYAALPARMEWFQNRAGKHPWNNPLYKGDPSQEYPTPNCDKTMSTDFIFFMNESFGEKEADMCMEAFRKVTEFYKK